jgi:hypothetical protein
MSHASGVLSEGRAGLAKMLKPSTPVVRYLMAVMAFFPCEERNRHPRTKNPASKAEAGLGYLFFTLDLFV